MVPSSGSEVQRLTPVVQTTIPNIPVIPHMQPSAQLTSKIGSGYIEERGG